MPVSSRVDVIIVNYRTDRAVVEMLKSWSLEWNTDEHRVGWVVVVDNDPGELDHLRDTGSYVRYVPLERNRGYADGVNRGWMETRADYVLLLNPDAEISLESIGALAGVLDVDDRVAAVAPLHFDPDGRITNPYHTLPSALDLLAQKTHLYRFTWAKRRVAEYNLTSLDKIDMSWPITEVDQPPASCLLLRRAAVSGAALMDEHFPFLFNDVDLARRLKAGAWKTVVVPTVRCTHLPGTSGRFLGVLGVAENHLGAYRYVRKWQGRICGEIFRVALTLELLLTAGSPASRGALTSLLRNRSVFEPAEDVPDPVKPYWPADDASD